jgi:hypothetical protein
MKLKLGDVVRLNSGSQDMTVTRVWKTPFRRVPMCEVAAFVVPSILQHWEFPQDAVHKSY